VSVANSDSLNIVRSMVCLPKDFSDSTHTAMAVVQRYLPGYRRQAASRIGRHCSTLTKDDPRHDPLRAIRRCRKKSW
jgi:hypothetical protein